MVIIFLKMLREVSSSNIPFWRWSLWIKKVCPKAATIVYGTCLIAIVALNVGLHLVNTVYQAQLLCRLHNQEEWRDGISVITGICCSTVQCCGSVTFWYGRMRILGCVPRTNGSGRPKSIRILRIRMRIRNTGSVCFWFRRIGVTVTGYVRIRNRIRRQRNTWSNFMFCISAGFTLLHGAATATQLRTLRPNYFQFSFYIFISVRFSNHSICDNSIPWQSRTLRWTDGRRRCAACCRGCSSHDLQDFTRSDTELRQMWFLGKNVWRLYIYYTYGSVGMLL